MQLFLLLLWGSPCLSGSKDLGHWLKYFFNLLTSLGIPKYHHGEVTKGSTKPSLASKLYVEVG